MENVLSLESDWHLLLKMLPNGWRELARSTKAISRTLRNFENEESVLQALLLHVANGYSLRETATRLKTADATRISDVALLKRLKRSEAWLKEMCFLLLKERNIEKLKQDNGIRMRLVDGTLVKEPGKRGGSWRLHYSLVLSDLCCDYFKITNVAGAGTGESFKQFPINKNDCIIGDRAYSNDSGIAYVASQGGYSLVRVNTGILKFLSLENEKFDLLGNARTLREEHASKEWDVKIDNEHQILGRLCIIRKTKEAKKLAIKKIRRFASRRGTQVQPNTEEFAGYVILFTTLPKTLFPHELVLEWYRIRWQIELVFKRLKSLIELGHLPKHDATSSRAWLYGKLLAGLLVEKLMRYAKSFSPWGYN